MAPIPETVISGLLLAIILLFIVPFLSYYLHLYYKHRLNPIISKRHYKIMMAFDVLLMISLVGDKSLYMLAIIVTDTLEEAHSHILYDISDYVYYFVGPTVVLMMGLSVWMLYYDTTWATVTNPGNNWTHFIDPQYNDNHSDLFVNNWFINNKQRFGNISWLTKHIVIPVLTVIYISLFASEFINDSVHYFVFMGWMFVTALFIGIIQWNIPKRKIEIFNIKNNIDKMIRVEVSFAVFFFIYILLRMLIVSPKNQFAVIITFQYIFALHYLIGGILPTRYVLMECKLLEIESDADKVMRTLSLNGLGSGQFDGSNTRAVSLSLFKILKEKISFDAFMRHLLKEFSSENLLCILECWQFKAMIQDRNELNRDSKDSPMATNATQMIPVRSVESDYDSGFATDCEELILNEALKLFGIPPKEEMPQSAIVNDINLSTEQKASQLMEKYVHRHNGHCLFEVNVSSACKYKMIQISQQLSEIMFTKQQFYNLFDEMLLELLSLLRDSHARFICTEDHKQLTLHDVI